jgi:glycosyltransferase involved in cell wall biosynthesis
MKKQKILRIITRLNIGGPTLHVVNLTYGLDDFETILVSGQIESHETDMSFYAEKNNVPVRYITNMSRELNFFSDLNSFWKLYRMILAEKPDIVHTHTAKAGTLGRIAARLAGVKHIYHTFHGNVFKGFFSPAKSKFFICIERILAKFTTKIIAISEKQKQELIEFGITKPENIVVIKLGFEFSHVTATEADAGKFRSKYNVPSDATLVAVIARVTAIKNHQLFLDIAEHFRDKNVYFAIVGDGDLRDEIQSEIDKRELKKVFITGFITELKPVYADIDIAMITSYNEGTPVALIETMANGKIVMSTNVGGISDFVENNVSGFYFDSFAAAPFVEKLNLFLENKLDTLAISEKAKLSALNTFSISRLLPDIRKLYAGEL